MFVQKLTDLIVVQIQWICLDHLTCLPWTQPQRYEQIAQWGLARIQFHHRITAWMVLWSALPSFWLNIHPGCGWSKVHTRPSTCGNHIRFNPRHRISVWSSRSSLLIKYDRLYYLLLKWIFLPFPIQVKLGTYISIHYGGPRATLPPRLISSVEKRKKNSCKWVQIPSRQTMRSMKSRILTHCDKLPLRPDSL